MYRKELNFLFHSVREIDKREYGSFDPARTIYLDIIQIILMQDENITTNFINDIDDELMMYDVSTMFPYFSYKFQSLKFIEFIENKVFQFRNMDNQIFYKNMLEDLKKAKENVDNQFF